MLMKKYMKIIVCFLVAVFLICSIVAVVQITNNSEPGTVQGNETTLGTLQDLLLDHLKQNGKLLLKPNTNAYYNYICQQLFEATDKTLLEHPHYELIHAYMVEYKTAHEDHKFGLYDNFRDRLAGPADDEFLAQTIGEIIAKNENN